MQIFHLHPEAETCAEQYLDGHISKGFIECSQMLSAAAHINGLFSPWKPGPYVLSSPMTQWVAASYDNWFWTLELALALYKEQHHRWGTANKAYNECLHFIVTTNQNAEMAEKLPDGLTSPPLVMPPRYRALNLNVVESYRTYYTFDKGRPNGWKWTNRPEPTWVRDIYDNEERWAKIANWRPERRAA